MKKYEYIDTIKNDIQLYNCIKTGLNENEKINFCFKLDLDTIDELYYYEKINTKTREIIEVSDFYNEKCLDRFLYDIEYMIKKELYFFDDTITKYIDKYEDM